MGWGAERFGRPLLRLLSLPTWVLTSSEARNKAGSKIKLLWHRIMYSFYHPLKWEYQREDTSGKADIKANNQLNQSKPQNNKAVAQDKEPTTNKPAKKRRKKKAVNFSACEDMLAASAWLRQDDRGFKQENTSNSCSGCCFSTARLPSICH